MLDAILTLSKDLDKIVEAERSDKKVGDYEPQGWSAETVEKMDHVAAMLEACYVYVNRFDTLLSGDDTEETFSDRLKADLFLLQVRRGG